MRTRRYRFAAAVLAAAFTGDSAVHLLWATGSTWPADDKRLLSYALLGSEVSFAPSVLLPLAGLGAFTAAVVWLRVGLGRGHRFGPALQAGTLALFTFLCVRAMAGLVWAFGIGVPPDYPPFYWLNLLLYTPACIALAAAAFVVSREGARPLRRRGIAALAVPQVLAAALLYAAYGWTPAQIDYGPEELEAETRYVDTPLARFHYTKAGSGAPVVLLSPGASWTFAWADQAARLAADHTVYTVDLPGQGFTELHDDDFAFDLDAMTEAIGVFLDSQGLERVDLAGNSWSGGWALAYAQRHPERVDRLALLAPTGADRPDPAAWEALKTPVLGELAVNLTAGDRDAAVASIEGIMANDERITSALVDAMWKPGTREDNLRSLYLLERGLDWTATEAAMPETEPPVLLVWGDRDPVVPVAYAQTFTDLIPRTELHVLDGCSHALTVDCPDRVADLMAGFLA